MELVEQLRLAPDLLAVMRTGVGAALDSGAEFVAPAHVMVGLLADPRVGPALAPLVPAERVAHAAADATHKLPEVAPLPEGALPDGEDGAFVRYDTLAFRSPDGTRTLYLDADAFHVFMEGARRARETYRPKHLALGFTAEAIKDRDVLSLFGADPIDIAKAVDAVPDGEL
jgi:hypothetical protein